LRFLFEHGNYPCDDFVGNEIELRSSPKGEPQGAVNKVGHCQIYVYQTSVDHSTGVFLCLLILSESFRHDPRAFLFVESEK